MGKVRGTVKWFNNQKGYGFVIHNEQDYFVHFTEIVSNSKYKTLATGQEVEFIIKALDDGTDRKVATQVTVVE